MDINTNGIQFGDIVKDQITGFQGKAIGLNKWLTGCAQVAIQPCVVTADGKVSDVSWFDVTRCVIVTRSEIAWTPTDNGCDASPLPSGH